MDRDEGERAIADLVKLLGVGIPSPAMTVIIMRSFFAIYSKFHCKVSTFWLFTSFKCIVLGHFIVCSSKFSVIWKCEV